MELAMQIAAVVIAAAMILTTVVECIKYYRTPKFHDHTDPKAFIGKMRYLYDNKPSGLLKSLKDPKENIYSNTIKIDHKLLGMQLDTKKEVTQDGRKRKTTTARKGRLQKRNGSSARSK